MRINELLFVLRTALIKMQRVVQYVCVWLMGPSILSGFCVSEDWVTGH